MISLVLLPGLDGTGLLFRPFVQCLPQEIEPLVISYPNDVRLGYEELLPIVLGQLSSKPFVLLGESFSGPLAVMIAAEKPAELRGLVLCASFVRSPVAFLPGWCSHLVRPFQFRLYPAIAHLRLLLGRFSDPTVRSLTAQAVAMVQPDVIAHRIRAVHRVNVADQLGKCPVPALYLRGAKDRLVPQSAMRACLRANPAMQCVTLAAPHMVLQTQPEAAARAIQTFIEST